MKRILYIEDSHTYQLIVKRLLTDPHEVTIVSTIKAAALLLAQREFDLIITDFLFPQGDALEIIVPVRQNKSALVLPIIAISGAMDVALMTRLLKAGVNACLAKPLPPLEFRIFVNRMLDAPFVENFQNTISTVSSFQWFEHGTYHEYCPEITTHLTGTDRHELSQRMQSLLQEFALKGAALGFTNQERVHCYTVQHGIAAHPEIVLQPAP